MNNDLISRSALLTRVHHSREDNPMTGAMRTVWHHVHSRIASIISDVPTAAPTIDAIEVIQCKDCTLYGPSPYGHPTIGWCRFYGSHRNPNFYCGFAERKEKG